MLVLFDWKFAGWYLLFKFAMGLIVHKTWSRRGVVLFVISTVVWFLLFKIAMTLILHKHDPKRNQVRVVLRNWQITFDQKDPTHNKRRGSFCLNWFCVLSCEPTLIFTNNSIFIIYNAKSNKIFEMRIIFPIRWYKKITLACIFWFHANAKLQERFSQFYVSEGWFLLL